MTTLDTFEAWPKTARFYRNLIVTEKIDGTNAQVIVHEDGRVTAASRSRNITPEDDNFGFAAWVRDHAAELTELGVGRHYGEWYGRGIQRTYGLAERRFALFNVVRWGERNPPECCEVVPVLDGGSSAFMVRDCIERLGVRGSEVVPGYPHPEGICIFHTASRQVYKVTFDGDGHKGSK